MACTGQAIAKLREIRNASIPCVKSRGGITGTIIQHAVDTRLKIPSETQLSNSSSILRA
jgi:hypothetical protein